MNIVVQIIWSLLEWALNIHVIAQLAASLLKCIEFTVSQHLLDRSVPQPCQLLELPPEIRFRIYKFYFASEPLWISKHQCSEPSELDRTRWVKHISCRIFTKSYNFLATCKQVYAEGEPLMLSESCYDFARLGTYKALVKPIDIPEEYLASIKSIACYARQASWWLDRKKSLQDSARGRPFKVNMLQHVTLIDDTLLLYALTQSKEWGKAHMFTREALANSRAQRVGTYVHGSGRLNCMDRNLRLIYLRFTVSNLQKARVETVSVQSGKLSLSGREIFISFGRHRDTSGEDSVYITVYGISESWNETAKERILTTLDLDTATTKFTFVPKRGNGKRLTTAKDSPVG